LDPGRQSIGSFHPITEGDWSEGTYFQPDTEQLCIAVNSNNINAVKGYICLNVEGVILRQYINKKKILNSILAQGTDVEARDPVGRTPLHIAVYANAKECAGLLLNAGARISSRLSDGRTPLHLAAQYGREDFINLLIEHGKNLPATKKDAPGATPAAGKKKAGKKANKMDEDEEDGDGEEEDEDKMEEDEEDQGDGEDGDEGDEGEGEGFFKKQKETKEKVKGPEEDKFDINFEDWDNVRQIF